MNSYAVHVQFDVEAGSPQEAALAAFQQRGDAALWPGTVQVTDDPGYRRTEIKGAVSVDVP